MYRVLLICVILLAPVHQALATNIPIEFTDKVYSDGFWYPSSSANLLNNGNRDGLAWRFVLQQDYNVNAVSGFMNGYDLILSGPPDPGRAHVFIYKGSDDLSPFLKPSWNLIYTSPNFTVPLDSQTNEYKDETQSFFLAAGDYWIGAQGGANDGFIRVDDFKLEGTVTTPEPSSLLLLGGGLAAAALRRNRRDIGAEKKP